MGDFQDSRIIKARKARACPECRGEIAVGQAYCRETGRWEGDFYTRIRCMPCHAFVERYVASMRANSSLNWDEVAYTHGDIIHEAARYVEYKIKPRQPLAEVRDAVMALFDGIDAAEREWRARDRENARRAKAVAKRQRENSFASRLIVRGMSACSAIPVNPAGPSPAPLAAE